MCSLDDAKREELKTLQREEAIKRMKELKILERVIKEFREEGKLNYSELGILWWLNNDEDEMIRNWEKETGNMVYHVIKNHTEFGLCYSLLYVSYEPDEWEYDFHDLEQGVPIVYVLNVNGFSEYGSIGVKPCFGGVIRTA